MRFLNDNGTDNESLYDLKSHLKYWHMLHKVDTYLSSVVSSYVTLHLSREHEAHLK